MINRIRGIIAQLTTGSAFQTYFSGVQNGGWSGAPSATEAQRDYRVATGFRNRP